MKIVKPGGEPHTPSPSTLILTPFLIAIIHTHRTGRATPAGLLLLWAALYKAAIEASQPPNVV